MITRPALEEAVERLRASWARWRAIVGRSLDNEATPFPDEVFICERIGTRIRALEARLKEM